MKILVANNETQKGSLEAMMATIDAGAGLPSGGTISVEILSQHTTDSDVFWTRRDSFEDANNVNVNATTNKTMIDDGITNNDFEELEKTTQQLIDQGYLPNS